MNNESIVSLLLDLGSSVTPQDKDGLNPIMTSCQYGHIQSLEKLGARGITTPGGCGQRWEGHVASLI